MGIHVLFVHEQELRVLKSKATDAVERALDREHLFEALAMSRQENKRILAEFTEKNGEMEKEHQRLRQQVGFVCRYGFIGGKFGGNMKTVCSHLDNCLAADGRYSHGADSSEDIILVGYQ
jgi:hypothetical protein